MNSFGKNVCVTLFGESHGAVIGAVLDGVSPGVKIDFDYINKCLSFRKGEDALSTARREKDEFKIVSGVKDGVTTGAPLTVLIENCDTKSGDYSSFSTLARPSHADFAAHVKYNGFNDQAGGGHFSGRITAPLVAVGAILQSALEKKGIFIASHIKQIGSAIDRDFENLSDDFVLVNSRAFAVLDEKADHEMRREILSAKENGDSVGGKIESAIFGLPAGVGEPFFDSLESVISHAVFSIGGVKGIEFGDGFKFCSSLGSNSNDEFYFDKTVKTKTNHNGGINGGISNGMPVLFSTAIKPTPTIFKEQNTVDYIKNENATISAKGRHDPCIVPRVRAVIDAVSAIAVADMLVRRFGEEFLCNTL